MPPGVITSALSDGTINPAALNIEFDLPIYAAQVGGVASYVRIWGLSISEIAQGFDLNNQNIKITGGMSKGYPLVDPSQQGLLIQGEIAQAFGNWIGTDMTLDMYIRPPSGSIDEPKNYTFTWAKGEKLDAMIGRVIQTTLPGVPQRITLSEQRVNTQQDKVGVYSTFEQFAQAVQEMTKGQLGANDVGVTMVTNGQAVAVADGTPTKAPDKPKQIRFQDLLGQVTWIAPNQISAKLVLRGDLSVLDWVQFPEGISVTTTPQAMSSFGGTGAQNPSNKLTFAKSKFQIFQMQHWGNFRQPDAQSWNTTIFATFLQPNG